jgi:uncharacterized membrane protein
VHDQPGVVREAGRQASASRLLHLDWLRGVAVLLMISWHVIDSWTVREGRDSIGFAIAIFFAGWAAPLFLFLAGVAAALAGSARMARGAERRQAAWTLQKRGWQVFLLAHLFRLQSFLLNPSASWNGLIKPDILNVLGLALVATGMLWGAARGTPASLVRHLLLPALLVVLVLTPLAPTWWWPTMLHPRLEAYVRPVGNQGVFNLFPAVGYVFAGAFIGSLMALANGDGVVYRWLGRWGAVLLAGGVVAAWTPLPAPVDFWTSHLPLFAGRVGTMMLGLVAGRWLMAKAAAGVMQPVVIFGQTSLFVYWVHVELVYSNVTYPLHHALPLAWSVAAYLVVSLFMLALAVWWSRRPAGPLVPEHMVGGKGRSATTGYEGYARDHERAGARQLLQFR